MKSIRKMVMAGVGAALCALPLPASAVGIGGEIRVGIGSSGPVERHGRDQRGRYSVPPAFERAASVVRGEDMSALSADELANIIRQLDRNLRSDAQLRARLESEIRFNGPRSVHPEWIELYQDRLRQRSDDLADIKAFVADAAGTSLDVQLRRLEADIDEEFRAQRDLVFAYR